MPSIVRAAAVLTGAVALAAAIPGAAASIPQGKPFAGLPYVGALVQDTAGVPGSHFCTASVVDSPQGNLVITSAHCMAGRPPADVAFAPGYANGTSPYGVYPVTAVFTDQAWAARRSINDDVAILQVGADVQAQTGALTLATGHSPASTRVIGYPDGASQPVECTTKATWFRRKQQLKFACGGYPDGTSGGPWILSKARVYGVIGGYQQGGIKSWISYSPYFGGNIRALYNQAVAQDS
ncbi:MAG: trypsin-like serine peptidase [Gemmatimonadota bacterium]